MTLQMRFKVYLIMYNRLYKPLLAKDQRQRNQRFWFFSCLRLFGNTLSPPPSSSVTTNPRYVWSMSSPLFHKELFRFPEKDGDQFVLIIFQTGQINADLCLAVADRDIAQIFPSLLPHAFTGDMYSFCFSDHIGNGFYSFCRDRFLNVILFFRRMLWVREAEKLSSVSSINVSPVNSFRDNASLLARGLLLSMITTREESDIFR